jgi:acetamidase/formamidase
MVWIHGGALYLGALRAAEEMARLLMRRLALSADEAYMLLSIRGDARVSQCAEPTMFPARPA